MKKLIYGVTFLALVGMIIGCQKDNVGIAGATESAETMQRNDNLGVGLGLVTVNNLNPYDSIGKYHNVMLDELLQQNYNGTTVEIENQVKLNTNNLMSLYFPSYPQIDLNELNNIPTYEGNYSDLDFDNYADIFKKLKEVDSTEANIIIAYINECAALTFVNDNALNSEMLIGIENKYISDKGGDFELFYLTSAILRYSTIYHFNNPNITPYKNWRLIIADVLGGAIGGAVGGVLGALQGAAAASTLADLL